MNTLKYLSVFLLMMISFMSLEAAQLHSIVVADTTDRSIGSSTAYDAVKILTEMKKAADYTELLHHSVSITGGDVLPKNVFDAINLLEIEADDVVVFYFSGHGYRTEGKEDNPWPNLHFTLAGEGVDLLRICRLLEEKHPRLLIVIGDVCNSFIPENFAPHLVCKLFFPLDDEELLKTNYQSLFLENQGTLMISSSEAGEYSWTTRMGSLFTISFLSHLNDAVKSEEYPEWETILLNTWLEIAGNQHPQWEFRQGGFSR